MAVAAIAKNGPTRGIPQNIIAMAAIITKTPINILNKNNISDCALKNAAITLFTDTAATPKDLFIRVFIVIIYFIIGITIFNERPMMDAVMFVIDPRMVSNSARIAFTASAKTANISETISMRYCIGLNASAAIVPKIERIQYVKFSPVYVKGFSPSGVLIIPAKGMIFGLHRFSSQSALMG